MNDSPTHAAHDALLTLAPPIRLVAWLETVFESKQAKGQEVPEQFVRWLERWKKIRTGAPCELDTLTAEEWAALTELVF